MKNGQRQLDVTEMAGAVNFTHRTRPTKGMFVVRAQSWGVHPVGSRVTQAVKGFGIRHATNAHRLQLSSGENPKDRLVQKLAGFRSLFYRHGGIEDRDSKFIN